MNNREYLSLVIEQIPRMKTRDKGKLLSRVQDLTELRSLKVSDLQKLYHWTGTTLDWGQWADQAKRHWEYCRHNQIQMLYLGSPDYPELLSHIYDPPFMLFVRGRQLERDFSAVALVGTRKPSGDALAQAFQVALDLALRECPVISGLARGIDGAAHQGAMAGWGWTLGVLASGVDRVYPKEHRTLAWEMLEGGGSLVSEYLPGTEPSKYRYPQRNRIISGLSPLSVVIQAPVKSGALITADFALQEGRDLCVGSSGINAPGTNLLAQQGASVITRGRELLDILGVDTPEEPGMIYPKPEDHRELTRQLDLELRGKVLPFQGEYYHGL